MAETLVAMKLLLHTFELRLRHVFTIARESISVQPTLIVELQEGDFRGYGEATSDDYYGATIAEMTSALLDVRAELENRSLGDPEELWEAFAPKLKSNPFAQCTSTKRRMICGEKNGECRFGKHGD